MLTVLRLIARLPLSFMYAFNGLVYWLCFDVFRWRRTLSLTNLRNAFPELSEAERLAIARQSYRNLAQLLAEIFKGARMSAEEMRRRVSFVNAEVLTGHTSKGQSVVLLASHHCNWEWLLLAAGARFDIPVDAVYKPQRVAPLDDFLRETRSRFGGRPIPVKDFLLQVLKRKGEARAFALVADQTPLQADEKYWTRFLNQDTAFFVGPEKIARITRSPVLFVGMRRLRRGYYEAEFTQLAAPPYSGDGSEILERYAHAVEAQIRSSPGDWLWLHRKWKYKKPAYA